MLLVDDDVALLGPLGRSLRTSCDVTTEQGARAALARIEAGEHYDVILCDVQMPELTGPELHAVVLEAHPDVARRFIFITGGLDDPEIRRAISRTGCLALAKPAWRADILAAIDALAASLASGL